MINTPPGVAKKNEIKVKFNSESKKYFRKPSLTKVI